MRKKIYIFMLSLLILSTVVAIGDGHNKTKQNKVSHIKHNSIKINSKPNNVRLKRSILDDIDSPFWPHRGKKENDYYDIEKEQFRTTRGRRESTSNENYADLPNEKMCDDCYSSNGYPDIIYGNVKHTREDIKSPFWGNRGRRSEEIDDNDFPGGLFWGSRGRRQDNEPFWGNRGRRHEDSPFWGQRGRREEEPFWGNRGRRHDDAFWGNRGRRDNVGPFWGNRGRREETEPFWGNRGRRDNYEPFWGNRGRRKETDPFWSSRGRRRQDIKESILNAINVVEDDIGNLSWLRRNNDNSNLFRQGGDVNSKQSTNTPGISKITRTHSEKTLDPGTVLDNRLYAEEPNFILVDRNSRSSAEDDPYYISRGKKYNLNYALEKAVRDRRGAIEEIVKSVKNDPFYIARGKKDDFTKVGNSTMSLDEFAKVRELICDLVAMKKGTIKTKRDLSDSERDRRTTLKKLAAQLQMDPYFVSRGKKSEVFGNYDNLENFVNSVANKCN